MFIVDNIPRNPDFPGARAEAFLAANPDEGIRLRARDQMARTYRAGFGLMITKDDNPCGVSLIYEYDVNPPGKIFHEIGTQRVSIGGHGLQVILALLHTLQIDASEDKAEKEIFAVVSAGTASEHNLASVVGMVPWSPPDALAVVRANEGSPFNPEKRVVAMDDSVLIAVCATLRSLYRGDRMFVTPKRDAPLRVDMRWFHPALLNLR